MRTVAPFDFYTSSQLVEITGRRAGNLNEFAAILRDIEESSIFYHVHHAFREFQFAPGNYTNDFARWVKEEIGENLLSERLASLNIKDFIDLASLRGQIVKMTGEHISKNPESGSIPARHKFYFCKNISVVQKTKYSASDLDEFCNKLRCVGLRSLFFHFFEARLRLGRKTNDFSDWIKINFGQSDMARRIEALNPYFYTMDELRDKMIAIICGDKESWLEKLIKWLKLK